MADSIDWVRVAGVEVIGSIEVGSERQALVWVSALTCRTVDRAIHSGR